MRKRTPKSPPYSIFIACEGSRTEPNYLSAIKEQVEEGWNINIIIYPDRNESSPKTDAANLLKIAIEEKKYHDEAWIVFDKNGHTGLEEVMNKAARNKVQVAFSSRSFEHWLLLHFEKNETAFQQTECKNLDKNPLLCGTNLLPEDCRGETCLIGYLRHQNYLPGYTKSLSYNPYPILSGKLNNALINAAWLRYRQQVILAANGNKIHLLNPYTTMDKLVLKLMNDDTEILWGGLGQNVTLRNWSINVSVNANIISALVSHTFPQRQILSTTNFGSQFFSSNNQDVFQENAFQQMILVNADNGSQHPNANTVVLSAGDQAELKFQRTDNPYFNFLIENKSRIIIEI